uniref:Nrf-6_0 protein n=3 Tax=Fopius arisanus TaxID=64838 RepID=A0A0C9RKI0_9HYME
MTLVGIRMQSKMTTLIVLMTLIVISTSMTDALEGDNLLEHTMPAYTIAKNADLLPASSRCRYQLEKFKKGVDDRKLWSLRILDASGAPKPGFVYGNNHWTGSKSQCHDTNNPDPLIVNPRYMENITLFRDSAEETPPYPVNYFAAKFRHNGTVQYQQRLHYEDIIKLGLCLPDVCRVDQLEMILRKIFDERTWSIGNLYQMDFTLMSVRDLKNDMTYLMTWRVIVTGIIILVSLLLVIVGTCYDLRVHQKRLQKNKTASPGPKVSVENGGPSNPPPPVSRPGAAGAIVLSFSAYTNSQYIFDTSKSRSMDCLDGLRFLSMGWVLLVHTALYGTWMTDNNRWSYRVGADFVTQIISNGSFSVDTFLFLSGFLSAYSFLGVCKRNADKPPKGFRLWELIDAIIKRFLRLTPPYLVLIGLAEITGGYLEQTSQYHIFDDYQKYCTTNWWMNLLYINNLPTFVDLPCMSWSWYLSVDMQLFIIGTTLMLIGRKYGYTALGCLIIMLLSSFAITGYIAYDSLYAPTIEELWNSLYEVYFPPWTRIGPYLIGLAFCYMCNSMKAKPQFKKKTVWFLWTFASACLILVVFGLYDREFYFSPIPAAIYLALSRSVWAIGIAWIVFACVNNYGGIVNSILSSKIMQPGSRLTYCAYLLNPLIISTYYMIGEIGLHIDFVANLVLFLGFFVTTFLFAYIYSLVFELPYMHLIKMYYTARMEARSTKNSSSSM